MKEVEGKVVLEQNAQLNLKPILEDGKFKFKCYPGISCFNACCHEIDVILTPFDVLKMKNQLGIKSDEFLAKYSHLQKLKGTDIPLVKLKMHDAEDKKNHCVFLCEKGCTVYESRPAVCRNYPTGLAIQDPNSGESSNPFFIIEEKMCQGHFEDTEWTVDSWKKNQGVTELDELSKPWMELVARLKSCSLNDVNDQKMNFFLMACFDLDTFSNFVFNSTFLQRFNIDVKTTQEIKADEEALLKFGFEWLRFVLFKEGSFQA
jgi:Fe-S-cluster containining protein